LTPKQWRQESDDDKAMMIATYRTERKMRNYEDDYQAEELRYG